MEEQNKKRSDTRCVERRMVQWYVCLINNYRKMAQENIVTTKASDVSNDMDKINRLINDELIMTKRRGTKQTKVRLKESQ